MEYDITWVGVSVGTMTVQSETNAAGHLLRSLRIWNRPWIAVIYPVDTTIECEIEPTPEGPRHTIHKKVLENDFRQDDTLVLWPDLGIAVWSNAVQNTVQTSAVPQGSRDLVSFFFDLRDALHGGPLKVGGDYQLVMDGAIHDLEIKMGTPKTIRTPHGRHGSHSGGGHFQIPHAVLAQPAEIRLGGHHRPAVIFADVESRFGPVRATLANGKSTARPSTGEHHPTTKFLPGERYGDFTPCAA